MKLEIKQRIEQIKAGQVPEGYKRTKIGVVPKEWEEVRFKKMFSRLSRKNCENNDNVLTISAQYGLISQSEFFHKNIASEDKSNYFLLHKGEYAYNKSYSNGYPYGALKKLERYEKGIVSPLYICFSPTSDNKCAEYYSHYFESNLIGKEIKAIAQEGARNHGLLNISVNDFFNMYILNPPLAEQEKIAKVLSTQDRIIELYQRKIKALQKMKKIYLSKMFPKKGENVPEWRFSQFNDSWEQRKAKEVCSIGTGKSNTQDQVDDGKYPFYIRSDVPVRSNKYLYDCEAVITIGDGNIGKVFHYVNGKFDLHQRCYKMTDFKDIWGKYFFYYFSTKFYDRAMKMTAKATVDSVRLEMISEMDIKKPPQISEQKQIAEFFTYLDNLITLHQRKLEETKKYKKALMQLLLTGIVRCK